MRKKMERVGGARKIAKEILKKRKKQKIKNHLKVWQTVCCIKANRKSFTTKQDHIFGE